ncbi:MAG: hypothetical protein ACRDQU_03125 [Pseudonocardiaceae bacterium]
MVAGAAGVVTGAAGVVTGAAAVTGAADGGTLGSAGCARGAVVFGGAVIGVLPAVRLGETPVREYITVAAASPATTAANADIPMTRLDLDRVTGAWNTSSGP